MTSTNSSPTTEQTPVPVPARGSYRESRRIGDILRRETVGGILLAIMAVIAVVWANSPFAESYFALRDFRVGYEPWHLELSLGAWVADGLLAIFIFMVGLELKREFISGDLRSFRTAAAPIAAVIGGVAVPAGIYAIVVANSSVLLDGWAIPTATDIAFAVAVLALIGSHLPSPLRIFLLTLAVVDDLLAISIIAIFYTDTIDLLPLLIALGLIAIYGVIAQRYRTLFDRHAFAAWLVLLPIGVVAWACLHASGIHATIAGVLLAFTIPVLRGKGDKTPERAGLAEEFEHRFRPISAGFAVPVFAFFSAGVAVGGADGLLSALTDPVAIGVIAALVLGKPIGIVSTTWLVTRSKRFSLDQQLRWIDITGVALLAGIGFTVSLLIAELGFPAGSAEQDHAKVAILLASLIAAAGAALILSLRNRTYRRLHAAERVDADGDGIPDVFQTGAASAQQ